MKKIIIADDSSTARMFVRKCLEIAGLSDSEFIEVADGSEVLSAMQKSSIDLVITDLNMPVMDGTELLKKIKQDNRLKDVNVVIVTSIKNAAKEAELVKMGAACVVAKPISPAAVKKVLESFS